MCPKKYKELEVAHKIASDLLLIGPSKEPVFMTDPTIGRGLSSKYNARLGSARWRHNSSTSTYDVISPKPEKRTVRDSLGTPFGRASFIASEARLFVKSEEIEKRKTLKWVLKNLKKKNFQKFFQISRICRTLSRRCLGRRQKYWARLYWRSRVCRVL